jgi:hypothetical protein
LERARWLTELSQAIAQAQKLSWSLGVLEGDCEEARELYARLEFVRGEVDSLRFGEWVDVRKEIDPNWLKNLLAGSSSLSGSLDK